MGALLTFVVIAAVSVLLVWTGIDGLRNPHERVLNINTGGTVPAGCSAPFMLLFGLGGLGATLLFVPAVEPAYWVVGASLLGPLVSTWVLLFVLPLGGGVERWLRSLRQRLGEGHPPHHLVVEGNSAAKRVLREAFGVAPPESPEGGGPRQAPPAGEEYRERVREVTSSTAGRWRRIAWLSWAPSIVPWLAALPLWASSAALEPSAWYVMLTAGALALVAALLLGRVLRQVRDAEQGSLDLLL